MVNFLRKANSELIQTYLENDKREYTSGKEKANDRVLSNVKEEVRKS